MPLHYVLFGPRVSEQLHLTTHARLWEGTPHLVDMLEQVGCNVLPERIKDNARSLTVG